MSMMQQASQWMSERSTDEQRILKFGVPTILLLVLYLLVMQPLLSGYFARKAQLSQSQEDFAWLQSQRPMVERTATSCDPRWANFTAAGIQSELGTSGRRFGLAPAVTRIAGSDSFTVNIASGPGNQVLSFIETLACMGASIERVDIQLADAASATVTATLRISAETLQ